LGSALLTAAAHEDAATRLRAQARVRAWTSVLDGLHAGTIDLGSRTPIAGLPAWVTLEVLRGGFATGKPVAGGPLQDDEMARADRLGIPHTRAQLVASYLTDEGLQELRTLIATGSYQVRIPEDAVLLVAAYLAVEGDRAGALDLLETVRPFVDTLRFAPRETAPALTPPGQVSRRTAEQVREALEQTKVHRQVEVQREALEVWLPLSDRFAALWWSTRDADGRAGMYWTDGHTELADTLTRAYDSALNRHRLCRKYRDGKQNLPILVTVTKARLRDEFSDVTAGRVERVLASILAKRGEPDGEALRELRTVQARVSASPAHRRLAQIAAGRCAALQPDEGVPDVSAVLSPVTPAEGEAFDVPAGLAMPAAVERKVRLATIGSVESLLADGVVPSAEVLAELLPTLTGLQVAAAYGNPELGQLVAAVYQAFRRRRSLLLVDLEKQVQFEELPWVAALSQHAVMSGAARAGAVARRVAALAIDAFPGTLLPNPLVQELTTLYDTANSPLPLIPELAADIFQGRFSPRFPAAARIAATLLEGSLYERYYDLDFGRLLEATSETSSPSRARRTAYVMRGRSVSATEAFDEQCNEAVPAGSGWSTARNGMVIEHQQLLTTQNLAVLITLGGVQPTRTWPDLAVTAAIHCARLLQLAQHQKRPLATVKDAAYAWRQALFFLTIAGPDEHSAGFIEAVMATTEGERWPMTEVLNGLRSAADGGRFDQSGRCPSGRRLIGWTTTAHWAVQKAPAT
jgi:hypothetical protein